MDDGQKIAVAQFVDVLADQWIGRRLTARFGGGQAGIEALPRPDRESGPRSPPTATSPGCRPRWRGKNFRERDGRRRPMPS